jgi:hypothetical protein
MSNISQCEKLLVERACRCERELAADPTTGTFVTPGVGPATLVSRICAMQEIKPDQIWADGLQQVQIVNAFGVRIVIQPVGGGDDEEIVEEDFRKRFSFLANG